MYGLKVVIIGAGIGGLTAGIAFKQAGYDVEIYERTCELRPAGAGISLWSNGVKVLNRLGLGEAIAAIGGRMDRMEYRTHTGDLLNPISLQPLVEAVGQRPYPVARTDLQRLLLETFGSENLHLNTPCVAVEQDASSATAFFADGSRATGDLVIGADGARSTVRQYVLGCEQAPRYAEYVNWNGLVEASEDLCASDLWVIYVGEGKRASMMPVGGERFYYFFGCPMPPGTDVPLAQRRDELAAIFAGWAKPVQFLIERLDPLQTNRLEIHDLDPLTQLVRGRVALLGDAGHATTPTLGQGGCQAMEDAEVLTRYLLTTNLGVADALQRYQTARQERTAAITLKARQRTQTIYSPDPEVTQRWYDSLAQERDRDVTNAIAKVILGGPLH
jgi:FAD-dependent urate hydroxylase